MTTRRPISWFLTDNGRKFSFAVVTGGGISLALMKYAPHTFFIDYYKDFVQYYRDGKPTDVPNELYDRYQRCLDTLKISDVHKKIISPFSVYGFDLFHAGSTSSKFGVVVGIPVNFTYKSIEDLEKDDIKVNQKKVDWSSETGRKLAEALIVPEKVQEFALCREILMCQNLKVLYETAYPLACTLFVFTLSQYINRRLNLYKAPAGLRGTLYAIIGTFGLGCYFLAKDMTEVHYESNVDKRLCELGREYIESGVIFYEKLLQRNQALRELMGSEGESKYSKLGNENFFIRQPRLALMHRKMFFEQKLKELSSEELEQES